VQHALLWNKGREMPVTWGPERTRQVNPLAEWLALGASLAAGTDIVRPFNPMTNVWGMVTRGTKSAGAQGPEHAIDIATAIRLYTLGTAELNGDADRLGSVTPGKLADLSPTRSTRSRPARMTWPSSHQPSPWSAAGPCTTPAACWVPDREGPMRYQATATCPSWIRPTRSGGFVAGQLLPGPAAAAPPGRQAGPGLSLGLSPGSSPA
jgi:Amidohydrolase family